MIKIDKQTDTTWYKDEIEKLLCNGNNAPDNVHAKYIAFASKVNEELASLGIEYELDDIITGEISLLKKIADENYNYENCENIKTIRDTYNKRFANNNLNNLLVEKLQITTCPYCNRDFINNRTNTKGQAQIDHFFNKKDYPLFALSLYNLIPSCYACNHIKHTNPIKVSPYDEDYDFINGYCISYKPLPSGTEPGIDNIEVFFHYVDDRIKSNIETLHINDAYKLHTDYISELLVKAKIYTEKYMDEIRTDHEGLFSSREEMIRILFANYFKEEDLRKRPLSKLTRDILLKETNLIE